MRRLPALVGLVWLAVQPLMAGDLAERVREAALVTYIHGMTAEIAEQEIGPEGVPYLLELPRDPRFERRDNIVAFLAFLAYDSDAPAIAELLSNPSIDVDTPEEFRARLVVPEALGRIAQRTGGVVAADLLRDLQGKASIQADPDLRSQVDHGLSFIGVEIDDSVPDNPGDPGDPAPNLIDPNPFIHGHHLTHANHVDTFNPIEDSEVDALYDNVTIVFGLQNAANDTACCIQFFRDGPGGTFGTPGDGLDVITTASELNQVIIGGARAKVVDYIGWCGGPGANIIGCGLTPGRGFVVVRVSGAALEGKLWAHEFGHNTGLGHNPSPLFVMTGGLSAGNTKVSSSECVRYHFPSGAAQAPTTNEGLCHDDDMDFYVSSADNCPDVQNGAQIDSDNDGLGNVCDNCPQDVNPDQVDCDNDGLGDVCDPESLIPGVVEDVGFNTKIQVVWSAVPFSKYIYRGSHDPQFPWFPNEELIGTASSLALGFSDPEIPPSGTLFNYRVTAFTNCGEGP